MDENIADLRQAASLGASFALSPIDPIGFVEECERLGLLAIPSGFTSNELWNLHRRGVRLIKLFHAGHSSPKLLSSMLGIGPLGDNLRIMPSGNVSPSNAAEWLDAGAHVLGMGSNLVGADVATQPGTAAHDQATAEWAATGRSVAQRLFADMTA